MRGVFYCLGFLAGAGAVVFVWTVGGFGPFWAVGGGGVVGCVQGRGLGDRARRAPLAFRDLSYWEASVTLYLWFRF